MSTVVLSSEFFQTVFDTLEGDEFLKARTRANPFETVKGVIFQNRFCVFWIDK